MVVDTRRRALIGQLGAAALAGFAPSLPSLAATLTGTQATPEALGVASSAIAAFIDAATAGGFELHSLLVARHGQVAASGWWAPYRCEAPHAMYSVSKSFTSTAVGFAVAEGKLKLSDRVVDFFPQQAPQKIDANLAALNVEHLLTMSVGQAGDSTPLVSHSQDWASAFLSVPIVSPPGSEFLYNSAATYMLSAIVQKVSGEKLVDYLGPRFFAPLGMPAMHWAESPQGINTGGWGLSATTDTLFKFGQFYLQKGQWNGRQLLPAAWIERATSFRIQPPAGPGMDLDDLRKNSDGHQGYGYQFWRCRYGGYRADGLLGQFCIVKPELDAVIVVTGRTADPQGLLNLLWSQLLPGIGERSLREDRRQAEQLGERLARLTLSPPAGARRSARHGGRRSYDVAPNVLGIERVDVAFDDSGCRLVFVAGEHVYPLACGTGYWRDGETQLPGTPPELTELIAADADPSHPARMAAAGAWKDDETFVMQWRYYETPHFDTVTLRFAEDRIEVSFLNSLTQMAPAIHAETRPVLKGRQRT